MSGAPLPRYPLTVDGARYIDPVSHIRSCSVLGARYLLRRLQQIVLVAIRRLFSRFLLVAAVFALR